LANGEAYVLAENCQRRTKCGELETASSSRKA
jgi:hypothetical protein